MKPLVISCFSALSSLGIGANAFAQGLQASPVLPKPIELFASWDPQPVVGAQVWGFDARAILGRKGLRNLDRNTRLVLACLALDLPEALDGLDREGDVGLAIGTTYGSFTSHALFTQTYLKEGFRALNPGHFPNLVLNSPPSQGNIRFSLRASSTTLSNGATSGIDALVFAADRIRCGYEKQMVCGASEELSYPIVRGLAAQGGLSAGGVARPLCAERDGTIPGEGAALFLVEQRESAEARGLSPLAVVEAWSSCGSGGWAEDAAACAQTAAWVLEDLLAQAGIGPDEVDLVSVGAHGRPARDDAAIDALGRVFEATPVVAYDGHWGDAGAASSALQLAAALVDLQAGRCSGTPHCQTPHTALTLPLVQGPQALNLKRIACLSLGDTGNAAGILLQSP